MSFSLREVTGFCPLLHWNCQNWMRWMKDSTLALLGIHLWSPSTRDALSALLYCRVRKDLPGWGLLSFVLIFLHFLFLKTSYGFLVTEGKFHPSILNIPWAKTKLNIMFHFLFAVKYHQKGPVLGYFYVSRSVCRSCQIRDANLWCFKFMGSTVQAWGLMYLKEKLQRNMKKATSPQQRHLLKHLTLKKKKRGGNKVPKEITSKMSNM